MALVSQAMPLPTAVAVTAAAVAACDDKQAEHPMGVTRAPTADADPAATAIPPTSSASSAAPVLPPEHTVGTTSAPEVKIGKRAAPEEKDSGH